MKNKGFTLIELLVVISIIGLLSSKPTIQPEIAPSCNIGMHWSYMHRVMAIDIGKVAAHHRQQESIAWVLIVQHAAFQVVLASPDSALR
jgi:prepilin-type N-terminal cleavage/methylation domain-containing protein